jgi:peptidoglycan hydrolase-like amidase
MKFARIKSAVAVAVALGVTVVGLAVPAAAEHEITIRGGGWGHGIGMSQYGARALADDGFTDTEILAHFYEGTSIGTVGTGALVGHADPLRIGAAQDVSVLSFRALGGPLDLCVGADCSLQAQPGDTPGWSIRSIGGSSCRFYSGSAPVGSAADCDSLALNWSAQPNTSVEFPALNRTYARGQILTASAPGDRFHLLVEVGLEEYMYGLGEVPSSWPVAALRAQAIAARTYALYKAWVFRDLASNASRMNACACHLYGSTKDQHYLGWAKEAEGNPVAGDAGGHWGVRWRSAVDLTADQALVADASSGRAIQAYYFSSSGGATENNEDVWGGNPFPYLRSKEDPGATAWEQALTSADFAQRLGLDRVFDAGISGRHDSGGPSAIVVTGLDNGAPVSQVFTGNQLRSLLGLRSHYIVAFDGFLPPSFSSYVPGDFDADGRDEVAAFSPDDGTWWVFNDNGGDMVGSLWADFSTSSGWQAPMVGDFNGDGRDDIAQFHPSNGTWWISRSTGSGFVTELWADFSTPSGWEARMVGDFNGDGRDDIAQFHPSNGTWWISRSTGSGFVTELWADFSTTSGWQARLAGDFNGDGRDDIAQFHPSNGTWWISRSIGGSFTTELWADFSTTSGWAPHLVGDFDGDGRDDIASYYVAGGTWWVSRAAGSSFTTTLRAWIPPGLAWQGQLAGDFDGDGAMELSNFDPVKLVWVTS